MSSLPMTSGAAPAIASRNLHSFSVGAGYGAAPTHILRVRME